ncbi:MAG: SDR family oxidoreductase [Caldilineaceae bacterium]
MDDARACGVDAAKYQCDIRDAEAVTAMAAAVTAAWPAGHSGQQCGPLPGDAPAHRGCGHLDAWSTRRSTARSSSPTCLRPACSPAERASSSMCWTPASTLWRHFSAHAAGKAGMEALTRQFALEFAPAVRVNAVVLGMVLPPAGHTQAKLDRAAARTLLGRIGTPDDATQAVRYLIEADYVTGECLRVDGGERYGPRPI